MGRQPRRRLPPGAICALVAVAALAVAVAAASATRLASTRSTALDGTARVGDNHRRTTRRQEADDMFLQLSAHAHMRSAEMGGSATHFKFERLLGSGAFGQVYEATMKPADGEETKVAVKVIKEYRADNAVEINNLAMIWEHPDDDGDLRRNNIVRQYGYFFARTEHMKFPDREGGPAPTDASAELHTGTAVGPGRGAGSLFIVLELCGSDLFDWAWGSRVDDQDLGADYLDGVYRATKASLAAMDFLHNPADKSRPWVMAHFDMKPENVILCPNPEAGTPGAPPYVAKLIDFGLAVSFPADPAALRAAAVRDRDLFKGTPQYIAPETVVTEGQDLAIYGAVGARDVWAVAVSLFSLLYHTTPQGADSQARSEPGWPRITVFRLVMGMCYAPGGSEEVWQRWGVEPSQKVLYEAQSPDSVRRGSPVIEYQARALESIATRYPTVAVLLRGMLSCRVDKRSTAAEAFTLLDRTVLNAATRAACTAECEAAVVACQARQGGADGSVCAADCGRTDQEPGEFGFQPEIVYRPLWPRTGGEPSAACAGVARRMYTLSGPSAGGVAGPDMVVEGRAAGPPADSGPCGAPPTAFCADDVVCGLQDNLACATLCFKVRAVSRLLAEPSGDERWPSQARQTQHQYPLIRSPAGVCRLLVGTLEKDGVDIADVTPEYIDAYVTKSALGLFDEATGFAAGRTARGCEQSAAAKVMTGVWARAEAVVEKVRDQNHHFIALRRKATFQNQFTNCLAKAYVAAFAAKREALGAAVDSLCEGDFPSRRGPKPLLLATALHGEARAGLDLVRSGAATADETREKMRVVASAMSDVDLVVHAGLGAVSDTVQPPVVHSARCHPEYHNKYRYKGKSEITAVFNRVHTEFRDAVAGIIQPAVRTFGQAWAQERGLGAADRELLARLVDTTVELNDDPDFLGSLRYDA